MTGSEHAAALKAFLTHPNRPPGTLPYHEVQGFLFTIAAAPELVPPSEGMPIIFGEQDAGYASVKEARAVIGALMALYDALSAEAASRQATLPADCTFRDEALANLEDDAPMAQWSRGFLRGHQWLEESWDACLPEELDEEMGATLLVLSFFSSKRLATAFLAETTQTDLGAMAARLRGVLPDAIAEYAQVGRSMHDVLMSRHEADATPRRSERVGRHEPCSCGSGRTFKKCCGRESASAGAPAQSKH